MDKDEAFLKELFFNQMNDFENSTAEGIIDILNNEEYLLETKVLGLIATARAIILLADEDKESKNNLLDTGIFLLEAGKK